MKSLITSAALGILLLFSQPWLPAQDKDGTPDLYPLKLNNKWHYRFMSGGKTVKLFNHIAKIETIDGQALARLETNSGGKVLASEHLSSTDKGVFRHRHNDMPINPPLCLVKYPVSDGDSWQADIQIGQAAAKATSAVGKSEVDVPAGKFKTVTVKIDTEVAGQKITTTYWFAPNVGMVKQTFDLAGKSVVIELEKFEPGK